MARTITTITDWDNVNWDEVDFDSFEMASLESEPLDRVSEFFRWRVEYQKNAEARETREFAETHFKRVLLSGRDPRSDRLFGKYHAIYQELIETYIPQTRPWDLAGIEDWSDDEWKFFKWSQLRYYLIDNEQPNWGILNRRYHDYRGRFLTRRYVTFIADWEHVDWGAIDFDHYDEDTLQDDSVSVENYKEYRSESVVYTHFWKAVEESKSRWDNVDFSQYDWSGERPDIAQDDLWNQERAEKGEQVWKDAKRKAKDEEWERSQRLGHDLTKSSREPETEKQQLTRLLGQAGITLPDEA